ncbi:hypothetical protein BN194_04880 [Lacticaseibacillus paracasei]|nr:hypothetical protein BN194_04880 [Lacticaseibacillus paracasei]
MIYKYKFENHWRSTMRNIGKLVALDWKRIVKSPFAFLLILALVVIPSLYCWFNVWALWDPYSNTQDLTVAVYSADKSTEFRDKKLPLAMSWSPN